MDASTPRPARRSAAGTSPWSGRALLDRYATVATVATFVVVGVTGVLIFYHVGNRYLMDLHEWMGMAFVVAAAFHLLRHLPSLKKLAVQRRTRWAMAAAAVVVAAFVGGAALDPGGGSPARQLVGAAVDAPVSTLAPLAGTDTDGLRIRFERAGIPGVTGDRTLREVAAASGVGTSGLLAILLEGGGAR